MSPPASPSPLRRVVVIVGGGALLAAMAIDAMAVVGRHVGRPLLGSIELVQAAVLIAGSAALIVATAAGTHAVVHLMTERARGPARRAMRVAGNVLAALFFTALFVGSLWLTADLWRGFEESELLRLPQRPLRILATLACLVLIGLFVRRAADRGEPR